MVEKADLTQRAEADTCPVTTSVSDGTDKVGKMTRVLVENDFITKRKKSL